MRVTIMTVGSHGDVAPFLGLGVRLQEHHDVTIATQESFSDTVRDHGLLFRPLPGNTREVMASAEGRIWTRAGNGLRAMRAQAEIYQTFMRDLAAPVIAAAEDADALLLQAVPATHGYLAGKAMGIPSILLGLTPSVPTEEFLPAMLGDRSLGRWGNRALMRLAPMMLRSLDGVIEDFHVRLGLPPAGMAAVRGDVLRQHRSADTRRLQPTHLTPARRLAPRRGRGRLLVAAAPARLGASRRAGGVPGGRTTAGVHRIRQPRPGRRRADRRDRHSRRRTGGRAGDRAGRLGRAVRRRRGRTHRGRRAARLAVPTHGGDRPPRRRRHHRSGPARRRPRVPVPVLADQPFWATRLARLGVSPGSVRLKRLSTDRLAKLIQQAVSEPSYRRRATAVAEHVRAEDGAGRVVDVLHGSTSGAG